MTPPITVALLIAASAALVAQNLLMTRMSEGASSTLVALVTNSAVGLIALTALLALRGGVSGLAEVLVSLRPWSVLPGLFGSFFVFASLTGYQRLGAAATISILVASQLLFGLGADLAKGGSSRAPDALVLMGAMLLAVGAVLVASRGEG